MNRTMRELLRAAISALGLIALLVGVPVLLVRGVGWPLPRSVPDLGAVRQSMQAGISDETVANTLAVIAWLLWAQLTASVLAEAASVLGGRPAVRLPILPGIQGVAEHLVAGIVLFSSLAPTAAAITVPVRVATVAASPLPVVEPVAWRGAQQSSPGIVAAAPTPQASRDLPTVTVQRHDSYWAIAERTLGDGMRWQEIHELNAGRVLADGSVIPVDDETIHTGWVLLLPADAQPEAATTDDPGVSAPPEIGDAASVTVERGDNLWELSDERLEADLGREPSIAEIAPYWTEVIDENRDRYVRPGNPDLILPGQEILLPATGRASIEPSAPPPPGPTEPLEEADAPPIHPESVPQAPTDSPTTTAPAAETRNDDHASTDLATLDEEDDWDGVAAVVSGGLASIALAVGLKRLIARRRRRFMGERGRPPAPTPPDQRAAHQAVVAHADEERIDDLQALLASVATSLAATGSERRTWIVRHGVSGCEIIPDQPAVEAPEGWRSSPVGELWTNFAAPASEASTELLAPAPLLVTIGQPEDGDQLYVDLEVDGIVTLAGDVDVASDLARSILTELTLSPLAENLRVISVGDLVGDEATAFDHLSVVSSWNDIADDIVNWAKESHQALADNGWPTTFVGRAIDPDHDGLVPIAVVATTPPPCEVLEALRSARPSAVALVLVGECDGSAMSIHCSSDSLRIEGVGLECQPQQLDASELAEFGQLLAALDDDANAAEGVEPGAASDARPVAVREPEEVALVTAPEAPPEFDVLVRLLGDITVEGGKPLKPKATSVVAYLAMNRAVATERLEEACWYGADGVASLKRLRQTMTDIRDALGSQHFPVNRKGTYTVGPRVGTDLDLFEWHTRQAASADPEGAREHFSAALELVTGRPFTYPNVGRGSFGWVDCEHHATTWEHHVSEVAVAYGTTCCDAGDHGQATALLRQLVRLLPVSSGLVEALMRAHLSAGDGVSAARVFEAHCNALANAKFGEPSEELVGLLAGVRDAPRG